MVATLEDRLKAIVNTKYRDSIEEILKKGVSPGKNLVDNSKVSDHHAIIPTELKADLKELSVDEKQLFDLIVRRFVVVLSTPHKYESLSLKANAGGESLFAKGKRTIAPGWKKIDKQSGNHERVDSHDSINQSLKDIKMGDRINIKSINSKKGITKAPARYNEASLLTAMENPSKFVKNKDLKETIKQGGLGTPATRADIIEKLLSSYYIDRKGRELVPTAAGMELIRIVPDLLKSPELTAQWEQRFTDIAEGREKPHVFINEIRTKTKELVSNVKNSQKTFEPKNLCKKDCPLCGKKLMEIHDKKGNAKFVCQSLACGYEDKPQNEYDPYNRRDKKSRAMNSRLVKQYSDKSKETMTLGDMLKAQMEANKKQEIFL